MQKKIEYIGIVAMTMVIVWLIVSLVDINCHNLTDEIYHTWNVFWILLKYIKTH